MTEQSLFLTYKIDSSIYVMRGGLSVIYLKFKENISCLPFL